MTGEGDVPAVGAADELLEPEVVVQFGRPPNRIDLIGTLGSVSFRDAWRRRVRHTLQTGRRRVPLPIIGLKDLLQSKRDAGRHKDLEDIEALTALHGSRPRRRRAGKRA